MPGKHTQTREYDWQQYFVSEVHEGGKTYWWGYYNQSTNQVCKTRGKLPMLLTENMVITVRKEGPGGRTSFSDVTGHDLYHALRGADEA